MVEHLTDAQAEHFLERGYVTIGNCFTSEDARRWVDTAWARLGYDREDPTTWAEPRVHLSSKKWVDAGDFAPRAFNAACDLLGGAERVEVPWLWSDGFIANLGVGADRPFEPPSAEVGGWHKDGDFFRHFLDSPEQGLLTLVLWTDVVSQGGGTFLAADSVPVIARLLAEHPEGLLPEDFDYDALIRQCHDFVEITGTVGDVVLIHPFTLHATSQNVLRRQRFITNPPLALREPMRFDRDDPDDFSLVERAVLRGLGVDRLEFRPTGEREKVVPERVRLQAERDRAEQARLAGS